MNPGTFFSSGNGWAQSWVLDAELVQSSRLGPPGSAVASDGPPTTHAELFELKQVNRYLTDPGLRAEELARVTDAIRA